MCHSMFITTMRLTSLKKNLGELSVRQLCKLDLAVHKLIKLAEKRETARSNQTTMKSSRKTYRLEYVRCGKKTCTCSEGKLHGPYWYAYWTENGKTKSQYIGKKLPKGTQHSRAKPDALTETQA
jgi:hypothetical protein